jgi:hypothetical protein
MLDVLSALADLVAPIVGILRLGALALRARLDMEVLTLVAVTREGLGGE